MSRRSQDPEKTGINCAGCQRPDDNENEMVFCDNCQRWYHFGCAGISSDVRDVSWSCDECLRRLADKERPPGLKDELEKLEQEMEKEKQAMEQQKILHKKKLEHQKKLFLLRRQTEKEKREMELAYEQEQMELLVAEEEAYQKKREEVLKQVQEKLEKVKRDSARLELLAKKIDEEAFGGRSKREKEGRKFKRVKPGLNMQSEKEPRKRKLFKPARKPTEPMRTVDEDFRETFRSLDQRKEQLYVDLKDNKHDPFSTNVSSEEEDSEDHGDESSDESSSLDEDIEMCCKSTTRGPTKAQLSARQFLSKSLPIFTGRLEEWPLFISAYETSSAACGFSSVENLARLQECLKGQALETVRSRLLLPSAVPQIIETLRMLYGRPERLLNMLLANVRKAPAPKSEKLSSYIRYGVVIQELTDHLEATGLTAHLMNPMLIQELTEKLPANLQLEWVRYRRKAQVVTLRTLSKFLSRLVKDASEIASYCEPEPNEEDEESYAHRREEQDDFREGFLHTPIAVINGASDQQSNRKQTACRICGRYDHRIRNCQAFKRLSVSERWEAVRKWRLCYLCLNEHGGVPCKLNFRCNVDDCSEEHHALLHIEQTNRANCNVHTPHVQSQMNSQEYYFEH